MRTQAVFPAGATAAHALTWPYLGDSVNRWLPPVWVTKFFVPSSRPDHVPRVRLLESRHSGQECQLILVSAPAGFGKTTVVTDWLRAIASHAAVRVAWLSLWLIVKGFHPAAPARWTWSDSSVSKASAAGPAAWAAPRRYPSAGTA